MKKSPSRLFPAEGIFCFLVKELASGGQVGAPGNPMANA